MKIFFITLGVFILTIIGMAVGVILSNRKLKGSCGGLGKIMGEDCMFCEGKKECEQNKWYKRGETDPEEVNLLNLVE